MSFKYDGRSRPSNKLYKENFNEIFNKTKRKSKKTLDKTNAPKSKGDTKDM